MSITVFRDPKDIPSGFYLTDCAVSGGTLEAFLNTAMALSGGKLCIRLNLTAMDFTFPCQTGRGTPVTSARIEQLKRDHPCHFSPALMTKYLSFLTGGELHAVLFDTEETLDQKLKLAEALGVPMALRSESHPQKYSSSPQPN